MANIVIKSDKIILWVEFFSVRLAMLRQPPPSLYLHR